MSRYLWRKYNQNSKKRSQLHSPTHEESRKVPLTPAERAKAYRERKNCAVSTSRVPVRLLCETPTMKPQWSVPEAKTMSWWWTPPKYPSCSPEKTSIRDGDPETTWFAQSRSCIQEAHFTQAAIYADSYWEPFTSIPTCHKNPSNTSCFKCLALTLKPLDWYFRAWTPTPRLRFYSAATSTRTSRKISRL
jgi:hypothetical protein